jgi:hypothetical protein
MVLDSNIVLLVVLFVILAFVIYFELRYMRSRNKEYMARNIIKDDAYNCIATTKAIADSLRGKGRNTKEADAIIMQAEQSYLRNNFQTAKEAALHARDILIKVPTVPLGAPVTEAPRQEPTEEERKTVHEVKKLEPNLIESRFIINACRDKLVEEEGSGKDLEETKKHLALAEACFSDKKYDDALREGLKARKLIGGSPELKETPADARLIKVPKPERTCPKCHATISQDDQFCRKCGATLESPRTCAYCQAELEAGDSFCPKCGRAA